MATRKRRFWIRLFLALLLLLLAGSVALLAYALFSTLPPPIVMDTHTRPEPPTTSTVQTVSFPASPVTEVLITLPDDPEPLDAATTDAEEPDSGVHASSLPGGMIPALCESVSEQIRQRPAYQNPLTHHTEVTPTRATITISVPSAQNEN